MCVAVLHVVLYYVEAQPRLCTHEGCRMNRDTVSDGRSVFALYRGDTVQPREESALGQVGSSAPHGITTIRHAVEKRSARCRP